MKLLAGWRHREELACRQAVELLTDYLEGALPTRQRERLEIHLRTCDGYRAYLEQIRTTISALGQARPAPPEPAVRAELIELYRRHHSTSG